MARIYYVGDWAVMLGPCFAETPFNYAMKGTEIFNYGTWLKAALAWLLGGGAASHENHG